ncbi:MAG: hypothetical protein KDK04_26950, partial [Candidatus Competibacteraceae bacterium]|nr:hypothetical protein [Candidatus Competibacteraceae bacterium]
LSAVIGWLDVILLPALIFFIGLTLYAVYRHRHGNKTTPTGTPL